MQHEGAAAMPHLADRNLYRLRPDRKDLQRPPPPQVRAGQELPISRINWRSPGSVSVATGPPAARTGACTGACPRYGVEQRDTTKHRKPG